MNNEGIMSDLYKKLPLKYKLILIGILFVVGIIIIVCTAFIGGSDESESSGDSANSYTQNSINAYWWPTGGTEVETEDDISYDSGEVASFDIVNEYGETDGIIHNGIDIKPIDQNKDINVVAVKSGEVVTVKNEVDDSEIYTEEDYGNYIEIKHTNGVYTVYGHLKKDSIAVSVGDVVERGQVIGKVGSSGSVSGKMLHFEVRVGTNDVSSAVDPMEYIDSENLRPSGYGNGDVFSLTSTTLSKNEFISKMESYCNNSKNSSFCNNFSSKADIVYSASVENNVNPELVVVTAGTEQGWKNPGGCANNNYWGIAVYNGSNCGSTFSSLSDGIRGYSETLKSYNENGQYAQMVNSRNDESEKAGCDSSGHGAAGTFLGMQSVYAWIGDYRYNPGSSGLGGCYFLNIIYGQDYCSNHSTCSDKSGKNCSSSSKTTVCEQNDYVAWIAKKKIDLRYDIFGL